MDKNTPDISQQQLAVLQVSVLAVACCGIIYELLIATVSSYLLGDSVRQFSITIGLFMAAMGLGAYVTKFMEQHLINSFVIIEIIIALVGGLSTVLLFMVFPFTALYLPVMYGLIIVIGALVGMEIPILTRVLSPEGGLRRSIAHVLSLDYLGALIGSIGFPLFLLPFLGLFRASFVIGLLNTLVALINISSFASIMKRPARATALTASVGVILAICLFSARSLTAHAEGQLYGEQIIFNHQTPYQKIVVTRSDKTGLHRLFLDGHIQFAEADEYRYHEALVHPALANAPARRRILLLGGGDGLAAREILKYPEVERIDLVDLDPAMTDFCASFAPIRELNNGALADPRVVIHNQDAWQFVRQTIDRFDIAIIDLPDPHNEALNKLYSKEFYTMLQKLLAEQGLLVSQSTSPLITGRAFWSIGSTMRAAGLTTFGYQVNVPSFSGNWGFTLATAGPSLPERFVIPKEKTRFLSSEIMAGAALFGKDEQPGEALVNSIFEPRLYLAYNKDVARW